MEKYSRPASILSFCVEPSSISSDCSTACRSCSSALASSGSPECGSEGNSRPSIFKSADSTADRASTGGPVLLLQLSTIEQIVQASALSVNAGLAVDQQQDHRKAQSLRSARLLRAFRGLMQYVSAAHTQAAIFVMSVKHEQHAARQNCSCTCMQIHYPNSNEIHFRRYLL